jgi:hypothetical protein
MLKAVFFFLLLGGRSCSCRFRSKNCLMLRGEVRGQRIGGGDGQQPVSGDNGGWGFSTVREQSTSVCGFSQHDW